MGRPKSPHRTIQVRVDKELWERLKKIYPNESNPKLSRILGNKFNMKMLSADKKLKDKDFKDKMGRFLYGNAWEKIK